MRLYNKLTNTSMSSNKYRRRRAMRTPTAGTKYQNEPIQAPLQKAEKSSSFDALGREDARCIAEQNNPNTRYVENQQQRQANVSCLMQCRDNKQLSEMLNIKYWEAAQFHNSNHQEVLLLLLFLIEWNLLSEVAVFV